MSLSDALVIAKYIGTDRARFVLCSLLQSGEISLDAFQAALDARKVYLDRKGADAIPPEGWGPVLTIRVAQRGQLWAAWAWADDLGGVLVHGYSLAEVLGKFPAAKAEVEAARAER